MHDPDEQLALNKEQNGQQTETETLEFLARRLRISKEKLNSLDDVGALQFAIVNGDFHAVKFFTEKGMRVNISSYTSFFSDEDVSQLPGKRNSPDKLKLLGSSTVYPLALAAAFNERMIYDYLIKQGADPNARNDEGNTVLHTIVLHNQKDMFSYAMHHPIKRANPWIKNNEGLVPVALCCKLGLADMFSSILELSRIELWRMSHVSCSLYPLMSLDSIGPDGMTDKKSALMIMVHGETDGHTEMINHEVIQQIVKEKWRVFAKRRFIFRLMLFCGHSFFISTAIYLRPMETSVGYRDYRDALRYFSELIICGGSLSTLMMNREEIKANGFDSFIRHLRNTPTKALMNISCMLLLCCFCLRMAMFGIYHNCLTTALQSNGSVDGSQCYASMNSLLSAEESLLTVAAPFSWSFALFLMTTHPLYGPLINTLYLMVAKDLTKVIIIFMLTWFTFALAFTIQFVGSDDGGMESLGESMMTVFQMNFGSVPYQQFDLSKIPWLTTLTFLLTMFFLPIMLMNILIASMSSTFLRVISQSQKEWFSQWVKIVLTLERAFSQQQLSNFQKLYTVPIRKGTRDSRYHNTSNLYLQEDQFGTEDTIPSFMVTKKMLKTKPKEQRSAELNWKSLYAVLRAWIREKKKVVRGRPVTFKDLFGPEDAFDDEHHKEKRIALALKKISLDALFKVKYRRNDMAEIAKKAMYTKPEAASALSGESTAAPNVEIVKLHQFSPIHKPNPWKSRFRPKTAIHETGGDNPLKITTSGV